MSTFAEKLFKKEFHRSGTTIDLYLWDEYPDNVSVADFPYVFFAADIPDELLSYDFNKFAFSIVGPLREWLTQGNISCTLFHQKRKYVQFNTRYNRLRDSGAIIYPFLGFQTKNDFIMFKLRWM